MNVRIIDTNRARARALAAKCSEDTAVEIWTHSDMGVKRRQARTNGVFQSERSFQDGDHVDDAHLTLHHIGNRTWTAPTASDGIEIWYGAGGPDPTTPEVLSIRRAVTVQAVESWDAELLRELVDWAAMQPEARRDAPLPRLLDVPAPDALLAYHLLGLLEEKRSETLKSAAIEEAKGIAGAGELSEEGLDDPAALRKFLLEHC